MFNENRRNNPSNARAGDQVNTVSSAALRWNQHPVISTVLWMLGSEKDQSHEGLQPSSSVDSFRPPPNPSGLDDYLNKHFEQVERRRSSSASASEFPHKSLGTGLEENRHQPTSESNSTVTTQCAVCEESPERVRVAEDIMDIRGEEEENDSDMREERTSSSDGTQLCPSSISSQYEHGYGYHYSTHGPSGQGSHYPAQHYQTTAGMHSNRDPHDDSLVDATPSPQWGFYVAITPPQQDMYNAIKKDLVTIQQQYLQSSTQKNLAR